MPTTTLESEFATLESELAPSSNPESRVGLTIDNRWYLHEIIGRGGMGTVHRAEHVNNGRPAAVKILHSRLLDDGATRHRFLCEALAANVVGHPGVVEAYDDGSLDDGTPFLVLELLQGENLEQIWEASGESLTAEEVLGVADEILKVLEIAHGCGVIHRDIKPDNIFVTNDGRLKLLDFGIAKITGETRAFKTDCRDSLGTPAFMPPEQARGRWDEVNAQSDLWAVGATMFTLVLGRLVHQAETPAEVLLSAMTNPAPRCLDIDPSLHPALAALIDRALSYDKEERFASAEEMRAEVLRVNSLLCGSVLPMGARAPHVQENHAEQREVPMVAEVPTAETAMDASATEDAEDAPSRASIPVELPLRRPVFSYAALALAGMAACTWGVWATSSTPRLMTWANWSNEMLDTVSLEGRALVSGVVADVKNTSFRHRKEAKR